MVDLITSTMQSAVEARIFPGAVLLVRFRGELVYQQACGNAALFPQPKPTTLDTLYDLASLTKPLATATATLCLVQDGTLRLQDPIGAHLPELHGTEVGSATLAHLLHHSSGLPGWRPLYEGIAAQERERPGFLGSDEACRLAMESIGREPLIHPIGSHSLYSDLGFILLGMCLQRIAGASLHELCRMRIYEPLGVDELMFLPVASKEQRDHRGHHWRGFIAPTEDDPWRGRILLGEVHDENAYALGGCAGHAGLFGTAAAVLVLADVWLDGYLGRSDFLSPSWVRQFVTRSPTMPQSSWGLGWDTPSQPSSSGRHLSSQSFGHLGFTGTSLWIDPLVELEIVLLSNRVHPSRRDTRIQQFRPLIHNIVYETIVGGQSGR